MVLSSQPSFLLCQTSVQPSLISHGPGHTCDSSVVAAVSPAATVTSVSDSWAGGLAALPWRGWVGWHGSASWPRAGKAVPTPERLDEGSCLCPPLSISQTNPTQTAPGWGSLGCVPPMGTKEQVRRERMLEHEAYT